VFIPPNHTERMNKSMKTELLKDEYINRNTGELVEGVLVPVGEGFRITTKEKEDNRKVFLLGKENKEVFYELAGRFTFTLSSTIKELNQDEGFTQAEKTRIMFLGTFVTYQEKGNYLKYDNGKPIKKKHLQELLEMTSDKDFYTFFNKLVSAGIIAEEHHDKSTIYLIWNSKYHFKGKAPATLLKQKNLVKTFDKQVRELYQEKNEKGKTIHTPNNLYTLFMVLPYIHNEENIICKYPENNINECEPLSLSELAEMFGYNRSNDLKRKLFKVRLNGLPVFEARDNGIVAFIQVNPFVIWKSKKAPSSALIVTFKETAKRLMNKNKLELTMNDLLKIEGK
jgi:hypothetical protein